MVAVSPKRDGYLNQISLDGSEPIGYTEDGYPVYEEEAPKKKPGIPSELVVGAAGGLGLNSILGGIGGGAAEVATPEILSVTAGPSGSFGAANVSAAGAAPGMFSLGGIGSAGNAILPLAGAVGLYDLANHRDRIGHGTGYLEGAASGAAIGSFFGPVGAAVGGGLGLLGNALGIGGKSRTKIEQDRRAALREQGIEVPNYDIKEWEDNPVFRDSRSEKDLKGGDIENAAQFYGINGYKDLEQAKKEEIAQRAIDLNLIREHHGTIDLNMTPEYQKYLEEQLGGGTPAPTTSQPRQIQSERRRERKKAVLSSIMPEITAPVTRAPDYNVNPGNLIRNPYL